MGTHAAPNCAGHTPQSVCKLDFIVIITKDYTCYPRLTSYTHCFMLEHFITFSSSTNFHWQVDRKETPFQGEYIPKNLAWTKVVSLDTGNCGCMTLFPPSTFYKVNSLACKNNTVAYTNTIIHKYMGLQKVFARIKINVVVKTDILHSKDLIPIFYLNPFPHNDTF